MGVALHKVMSPNKLESDPTTKRAEKLPRLSVALEKRSPSAKVNLNQQAIIQAAEQYLETRAKRKLTYETIRQDRKALTDFIAFTDLLDTQTITAKLLETWIEALKDRALSPNTIDSYRIHVKQFFAWLLQMGSIDGNPWDDVRVRIGSKPLKRETFTEDEYDLIVKKSKGTIWNYAAIVGWNTGLRMVDVANLRYENIDWQEQVITLIPRKTKRSGMSVCIPWLSGSDLAKLLVYLKFNPPDDSGYLCPVLQAMTSDKRGGYQAVLEFNRWLRKKCKIVDKTFHTFRRTLITRLITNGADSEAVRSIVGIKDRQTLDHYFVPTAASAKTAMLTLRKNL